MRTAVGGARLLDMAVEVLTAIASLPLKPWQVLALLALALLLYVAGGKTWRLWRIWRAHKGLPTPPYGHLVLGHLPKVQRRRRIAPARTHASIYFYRCLSRFMTEVHISSMLTGS